jgi:hypothetical protein
MGGGLLQLVACGAQDAYLSGNPQITFWKGLFKRHTNFAMEPFRINFTGQSTWGTKQSAVVGRHADLLYSTYLEVVLPYKGTDGVAFNWNNEQGRLGYNLIKYAELEIGGQLIDRLYGEWMFLWDSLSSDTTTSLKLYQMVGGRLTPGSTILNPPTGCGEQGNSSRPALPNVFYVPLAFFYTRNPGAALPLIALQYHEVKINVMWNQSKTIAGDFTKVNVIPAPTHAAIYIDYIYLDTEERRRMAQESHEYLIEQTQYNEDVGISSYNNRIDLTFNHPVKELVWVVQPSSYTDCKMATKEGTVGTRLAPFTYDKVAVHKQWLQINGQDRMDYRYGDYFNKVQTFQHHTGSFTTFLDTSGGGTFMENKVSTQAGAYMYSFALKPEEHQPSGTCNFSRIDTATIVMEMSGAIDIDETADKTFDVRVYAVNYNILRIMSGMAGLAYSN